jgi:putative ABC transport system substrate-binding protein
MRRRELMTLIGGAAAWPLLARAQPPDRVRRIAIMLSVPEDDRSGQIQTDALHRGLRELGWAEGRNLSVDLYGIAEPGRALAVAKDIVAKRPELICSIATPATAAVVQATKTIPIVFANVADPVSLGFVTSYARPGGNVTGFSAFEPFMGGKWVEILHDLDPRIRRIAILFNPETAPARGNFFLPSFKAAATALGIEAVEAPVDDVPSLERAIGGLSGDANDGLVTMPDAFTGSNRDLIIRLALNQRVPLVAGYRTFSEVGALVSYGSNSGDLAHHAASYVDRILRGEKPADLPIQAPTKFDMVINLRTAKALGLTVPPALSARANVMIE